MLAIHAKVFVTCPTGLCLEFVCGRRASQSTNWQTPKSKHGRTRAHVCAWIAKHNKKQTGGQTYRHMDERAIYDVHWQANNIKQTQSITLTNTQTGTPTHQHTKNQTYKQTNKQHGNLSLRCAMIQRIGATTNKGDGQTGKRTIINTCSFTRARGQLNKIKEQNRWQNKPSGRLTNKQTQQTKTTNKQTAKQTNKTKKQTNKHTHANKHANTHTHKQTKQTNKQPNKTHRHKQTN